MKTDKLFNATYSGLIGFGLTALGIIVLIGRKWLYINLVNVFLIAVLILSLRQLINYFIGREKEKKVNFARSFFNLLFCLVLSLFKNIPISFLPIIFGIYLLVNALIRFITCTIYFVNKTKGKLIELFVGLIYLGLAIPSIFTPIKNLNVVLVIIGIYILLLGINYIFDFIGFLIPIHFKNKIRRNIRITLPAFIEAIIPYTVLSEINYLIDKDNYESIEEINKKDEVDPDMIVFVHISNRGFNRMGHVDLYYDGRVITYGGYDDSSLRFFRMIGDGVLYTVDKESYIPFCIKHSKKTIFAFGLRLSEKQKKNVSKTIDNLFKDLYPWECPYQSALNKSKKVKKKRYKDYASKLYQATNAKFYKFKKGKFKKFFVVGSNCSKLADYIIGKSGVDILKVYGIITPGAYYEYLNREYNKKGSMVISRKIYNSKNIDKSKEPDYKGFSK